MGSRARQKKEADSAVAYTDSMPRVRKPSPRNFSSPQLCGGKRIYRSQREAEIVKEEQELLQHDLTLAIYHCAAGCRGWHLTRRSDELHTDL